MLHIPINSILTYSNSWRQSLQLPIATTIDWSLIREMELFASSKLNSNITGFLTTDFEVDGLALLEEKAGQLSFFNYLQDRMLIEAELYFDHRADTLMLENIAAPYFVRDQQPVIIFAVMSLLARILRKEHPKANFGIQILAFGENQAMDIAVRHGFSFIRGESLLFGGMRPEGITPNKGNLAKLNLQRNMLMDTVGLKGQRPPNIYIDLQKKHTIFNDSLATLDTWLENLLFLKLEGIILTGSATGKETHVADIMSSHETIINLIQKTKKYIATDWNPEIIVGSGATSQNLKEYKKYASAVIVGSSLKENGYWECPLDQMRLEEFMSEWYKGV